MYGSSPSPLPPNIIGRGGGVGRGGERRGKGVGKGGGGGRGGERRGEKEGEGEGDIYIILCTIAIGAPLNLFEVAVHFCNSTLTDYTSSLATVKLGIWCWCFGGR